MKVGYLIGGISASLLSFERREELLNKKEAILNELNQINTQLAESVRLQHMLTGDAFIQGIDQTSSESVQPGNKFVFWGASNPSTGFSWSVQASSCSAVLAHGHQQAF